MKKNIPIWILSIAASFILSTGLLAQEQTEVTVKIKKDGKVVTDTTYLFDDMDEAKHALEMMDLISGDDIHKENIHYNITSAHTGSGEAKTMVFISEDGETTEITEFDGDSNVWVTEEDGDTQGKKVIVMKSDDGATFDILVDEDSEGGDVVKTKEVRVMVSGDEDGNWTVVEGDEKMTDEDENVFIMKGDHEVKVKVMKIVEEEGDGENVKVIVITESGDVDCDHDEDHDEDCDHDHDEDCDHDHDEDCDHDHDEDVEVKVVKKKKVKK